MYEAEVVSVDTGEPVVTPEVVANPQPEVPEITPEVKPEEVSQGTQPEKAEEVLVELPDGRKLPPKEAEAEHRRLYSEYTRKSQELATYKKSEPTINNQTPESNQLWEPGSWEEVQERVKQSLREDLEREKQAEQENIRNSENLVMSQLEEIKKENPSINENLLFQHAMKYGFNDLKVAHSNFKDMQESIKRATEATVQNVQKRQSDPISGGPQGGTVFEDDVYDPSARNTSLTDYLRSLKQ